MYSNSTPPVFLKTCAKIFPITPGIPVPPLCAPFPGSRFTSGNTAPVSWPSSSKRFFQDDSSASALRTTEAGLIYVVDNEAGLTELYTHFLKGTGYLVRAFNLRATALATLTADAEKPDLLVTDYCGLSMPVDRFMHQCLAIHPRLRILMASGFRQSDMRFAQVRPHRFLQKPFTAEEFLQEVSAALAA